MPADPYRGGRCEAVSRAAGQRNLIIAVQNDTIFACPDIARLSTPATWARSAQTLSDIRPWSVQGAPYPSNVFRFREIKPRDEMAGGLGFEPRLTESESLKCIDSSWFLNDYVAFVSLMRTRSRAISRRGGIPLRQEKSRGTLFRSSWPCGAGNQPCDVRCRGSHE